MSTFAWGTEETKFFFELTPDKILDAVESSGIRCTGRCLTLNSMENRVYEVEIECDRESLKSPSDAFLIAKFYRPGRWSKEQIQDEHQFLLDLQEAEIPVAAPIFFEDGTTIHELEGANIWYSLFPKIGGRSAEELNEDQYEQLGRLIARMHNVGSKQEAKHRIELNIATYGRANLAFVQQAKLLPMEMEASYISTVEQICDISESLFEGIQMQRVHGDAHFGNLLHTRDKGFFWVDFDDMVVGPCVQDLWLVTSGRDATYQRYRNAMLDGYEQMRDFNYKELKLIEVLRALRYVHFNAWIGKRWQDPAFPKAFPQYGTMQYWQREVNDLKEQLILIQNQLDASPW